MLFLYCMKKALIEKRFSFRQIYMRKNVNIIIWRAVNKNTMSSEVPWSIVYGKMDLQLKWQSSLWFFGYILTKNGLQAGKKIVEAIQHSCLYTYVCQRRSFLRTIARKGNYGMQNYARAIAQRVKRVLLVGS